MSLTIQTRPERALYANNPPGVYDQSYYTSMWNSAGGRLPIRYKLLSDKFPINTFDDVNNITTVSDYNGYAQINLPGTYETYVALEYVKVESSSVSAYNGVWQIVAVLAPTQIVINCVYSGTATGTIQRYYKNYQANVKIFVGIPPTHTSYAHDPISEIATVSVSPNSENVCLVDISPFVKEKLGLDFNQDANDLSKWTAFYISYAESYDVSDGNQVTSYTSSYIPDEYEGCAGEKITNGSFTGNINGWANAGTGGTWAYGVNDARVAYDSSLTSKQFRQSLSLQKGVDYDLSFIVANNDIPYTISYKVTLDYSFGTIDLYSGSISGSTSNVSLPFTAVEDDVIIAFEVTGFSPGRATQYFGLDDVSIMPNDCNAYLYAINGVRQFNAVNGGNFGEYVINFNNSAYDNKFLTVFDSPVLFDGKYLDINCIIPKSQFDISQGNLYCKVDIYNGSTFIRSEDKTIENLDDGVYRLRLDDVDYSDGDRIKIRIYKLPSNLFGAGDSGNFDYTTDPGGSPPSDWGLSGSIEYNNSEYYQGIASAEVLATAGGSDRPIGYRWDSLYNTNPITVSQNSIYKISAYVKLSELFTPGNGFLNGSTFYLLPIGYGLGDCISIGSYTIDSSAVLDSINSTWHYIETTFNSGSNSSIQVGCSYISTSQIDATSSIGVDCDVMRLEGPFDWMSEEKTILIDNKCSNQSIHLRWVNPLGGDEYWNFTAVKDYETSIEDSREYVRDPFQDWDSGFINNQTQGDNVDIEAYWTVTVRAQFLTLDQIKAIGGDRSNGSAGIIGSIRVTDISDIDNPITVLVDKRSLKVRKDRQKLYTIEFDIKYPRIEIQNQ